MMIHAGAHMVLGGGDATNLVCCDVCGVIAAERVAQTGGWGMWWGTHRVAHHHCPQHITEDGDHWYVIDWNI